MKAMKMDALAGLKPLRRRKVAGKIIRLRDKKLSDVRNDYRWQSDPELARLDAAPPLAMPFSLYLLDYAAVLRTKEHHRYPLGIETLEGRHIGNCTAYDIDEKRGEAQIGIMLGDKAYWNKGYGTDSISTLVDFVFESTGLERLYLKTLDWNKRAQKCFTKCGFTPCGHLMRNNYNFMIMELYRGEWEKTHGNGSH
jgi:RimJ/RimL family protein N-acetyltransferase